MWPLLLCIGVVSGAGTMTPMTLINDWQGRLQGEFNIQVPEETIGWEVIITFTKPVTKMDVSSHMSHETFHLELHLELHL